MSTNAQAYASSRVGLLERSRLTREALAYADELHAGQTRDADDLPFMAHPVEVGCLLQEAGYSDEVVAAGVLHDVVEDTDAEVDELERRFGPYVAHLVAVLSDDEAIEDDTARKAALRAQVAQADECAAAVFAADKVSKARELRARVARHGFTRDDRVKIDHYDRSLAMLSELIAGNRLVEQLRTELEAVRALP